MFHAWQEQAEKLKSGKLHVFAGPLKGTSPDGETIEIKEGKKSSQRYKDIVEVTGGRLTPEWIEADLEALKGVVKERPTREMIDVPVDEVQIVELYSK